MLCCEEDRCAASEGAQEEQATSGRTSHPNSAQNKQAKASQHKHTHTLTGPSSLSRLASRPLWLASSPFLLRLRQARTNRRSSHSSTLSLLPSLPHHAHTHSNHTKTMTCCLTESHSIPGFVLLVILAVAAPTVIWCVTYFLPLIVMKLLGPQDLKKKYQAQWALVTGGSSGIGRAIVDRLALQGLNVCVVSIDDDLLKNTVKELKAAFPKQVREGEEGKKEGRRTGRDRECV